MTAFGTTTLMTTPHCEKVSELQQAEALTASFEARYEICHLCPCSADDETGMAYDSLAFNQRDPLAIDIEAEFEARYWSRVLGISRIKLREAISVSGSCNAYVVAHCVGCDLTALTKQKD